MNKRAILAILLALMLVFSSSAAYAMEHEDHEETEVEDVVEDVEEEVDEEVTEEEATEEEEAEEEADEVEETEEEVEEVEELEEEAEEATAASMILLTIDSNTAIVDGQVITLDVAPFISENRTMVPMAFISRQMGADVVWDGAARTVTFTDEDTTIVLTIDSTTAMVNGVQVELDSAPMIHVASGRTMVPVKFVGDLLGYEFAWDGVAKTVTITAAVEEMEMEETEEEVTEEEMEETEEVDEDEEAADENEEVEEEEAVEGEEEEVVEGEEEEAVEEDEEETEE